jgi:CBS domain-containing protein
MAQKIRDVMTPDPVTCDAGDSVLSAARAMKEYAIGDVLVMDGGRLCGVVTDRDLVMRVMAERRGSDETKLRDVCSRDVATLSPDDDPGQAVRMITERAVRRIPIVENDSVVGVVTIGDLAMERDAHSALATLSGGPPNNR